MRMRKIQRAIFDNPSIRNDANFPFDPQKAVNAFFDHKWLALQRAKAAAAAKAKAATAK